MCKSKIWVSGYCRKIGLRTPRARFYTFLGTHFSGTPWIAAAPYTSARFGERNACFNRGFRDVIKWNVQKYYVTLQYDEGGSMIFPPIRRRHRIAAFLTVTLKSFVAVCTKTYRRPYIGAYVKKKGNELALFWRVREAWMAVAGG